MLFLFDILRYSIKAMISFLKGKIILKEKSSVFILTQGGVGYKVFFKKAILEKLSVGDFFQCFCHLNVREDALDLYGFQTEKELYLFELLITISGVGPRAALKILSLDEVEKIAAAILNEDYKYLTNVSGIGPKTAKKIAVELKDQVLKSGLFLDEQYATLEDEVIDALQSLGYSKSEIKKAALKLPAKKMSFEDKIKELIKIIGRQKR